MKKRLIALSLALVLLLSILPVTVYAKYEEVDRVYLEGFRMPIIEETAEENLSCFHVYEKNGLEMIKAQWMLFNGSIAIPIPNTTKFVDGKVYILEVTLKLEEGYAFSSSIDTSLDDHHDYEYSTTVSGDEVTFLTTPIKACKPIEKPTIIGFQEPQVGQAADQNLKNIAVPEGANYTIENVCWVDSLLYHQYDDSTPFKEGSTYYFYCYIKAKPGYAFVVPPHGHYTDGSLDYQIYDIDCCINSKDYRIPAPDNMICDVAIEGYNYPVVGQTVADNLKTLSVPGAQHYSFVEAKWYCNVGEKTGLMDKTQKFVDGESYELVITVQADSSYSFVEMPGAKINGSERMAAFREVDSSGTLCNFSPYETMPISEKTISDISISGYQAPKSGQTVGENLKNLKVTSDHITVKDFHWTREDKYRNYYDMTDSEVFSDEYDYMLEFELETKEGYSFFTTPNITVSGDVYADIFGEVYGEQDECIDFAIFPYSFDGIDDCGNETEYCPSRNFIDVPDYSDWAHKGIDYVLSRGLFNGTGADTFSPKDTMTRAMLVTVLWRYEGAPKGFTSAFSDVPAGEWYTDAVAWANAKNIVNGVGENKFDPNGTITREQMAAILHRYATAKGFDTSASADLSSFPDVGNVGEWATDAMKWAVGAGMITGSAGADGKVCLMPGNGATREQVAAILMRFIKNIAEK